MIELRIIEVTFDGTIAVAWSDEGLAVALETRMAHAIAAAIDAGERPIAFAEPWQVLWGADKKGAIEHDRQEA